MANYICVKDKDMNMFVYEEGGEIFLTNNIMDSLTFDTIDEARQFAYKNLDDDTCYDVVNLKVSFKVETVSTINY